MPKQHGASQEGVHVSDTAAAASPKLVKQARSHMHTASTEDLRVVATALRNGGVIPHLRVTLTEVSHGHR